MSSQKLKNFKAATRGVRIAKIVEDSGLTQTEFGERVGVKPAHVTNWVKDYHSPSRGTLLSISREFGVNEQWLIDGSGAIYKEGRIRESSAPYGFAIPAGIPEDIPVVERGAGGRNQFNTGGYPVGQGYRRVRRPFDVADPKAFAVEVTGDSMSPRYEQGDIVICSPAKDWKRSGDYCVVVKTDDEALVKRVKEQGESFMLLSLAPGYDPILLDKKEVRAIHKIVWKKER